MIITEIMHTSVSCSMHECIFISCIGVGVAASKLIIQEIIHLVILSLSINNTGNIGWNIIFKSN